MTRCGPFSRHCGWLRRRRRRARWMKLRRLPDRPLATPSAVARHPAQACGDQAPLLHMEASGLDLADLILDGLAQRSTCTANVLASLLSARSALSCWGMLLTWARRPASYGGHVNCRHLGSQHGLKFVSRANTPDYRQHKIRYPFVGRPRSRGSDSRRSGRGCDAAARLAPGPISLQRFHLHRKRAGQLVERPFRTVLLGDVAYLGEAAGELWWPCELPPSGQPAWSQFRLSGQYS